MLGFELEVGERGIGTCALRAFKLFGRECHFFMRIHRGVTTTVGITLSAKLS